MIIRRERAADHEAVQGVHADAFRAAPAVEPMEVRLLDGLRADVGWLAHLSIVAELNGTVVGHCVCTRGFIGSWPVLGLGPVGVRPDMQGGGVGLALVHASIGAADATDEALIALLGSPGYYRRFGFVASRTHSITPPDAAWGDYFQVLPLSAYQPEIRGSFAYAAPFRDVT